jgi:hypothetical protein
MKKETKTRVNKAVVALAEYKELTHAFIRSLNSRKSVEHSRTAGTITKDGKTGASSILINELTTIVKTASKLDKLVVLGINGDNLVVLLEDKIPAIPYPLNF